MHRWRRGDGESVIGVAGVVRLGSPSPLPEGIGSKAGLLHAARAAGLRVPIGWVVGEEALSEGAAKASEVAQAVSRTFPSGTQLAVRSAFSAEDTSGHSRAGHFLTVLRVQGDDPVALAEALRRVWASADASPVGPDLGHQRRDILVMAMVDAIHAGVAALSDEFEDDLVEAVEGTAETLVAGTADDVRRLLLPRLRGRERAHRGPNQVPLAFWAMRLTAMLAELRKVVGPGAWDVEWADDGEETWLIQVRPLTAPVQRRETLATSNFREILPEVPSPFMASLVAERAPATFGLYRAFDASLPRHRPFATVVDGRPYVNLSLLEDMLRRYGLPTQLLADAMGGASVTRAPLRPGRVLRSSPTLTRMALRQLQAPSTVPATVARLGALEKRAAGAAGSAATLVTIAGEAYEVLLTGMVSLATFIGPGMALLRASGTLSAHATGHMTVTSAMWEDVAAVRAGALGRDEWLERHGHRGAYETDLARPRFAEAPDAVDDLMRERAVRATRPKPGAPSATMRARLAATWPLWEATARAVRAREDLRSAAMRTFLVVRRGLLDIAGPLVTEGALGSVDDLWLLTAVEVRSLDHGWRPPAGLLDERRREQEAYAALSRDDLLPGDHQAVVPPGQRAVRRTGGGPRVLSGLGLTGGDLEGVAWVCDSPGVPLPEGFDPGRTILVTRAVDAGWLPTFASVSGVVVELGGDLSHGSILLREMGIPSVTNCRGVLAAVSSGDRLLMRPSRGEVRVLGG